MGISASSLLDETKSNYIKGQAQAELKEFSPYYRKQFSVARFSQVEDDLEPQKEKMTQLLKHRESPEAGAVLYEDLILFFDETRKWRERYVVVRANYCLECHDSLETFVKGVPPRQTLLPTGGTVLTTEEKYMAMVDKCFPDESNLKEDFAPPLSGMPGQFPVYLRLPYRRDSYFCFKQQAKQAAFLSILSDCIRHQNQDFLKKKTCEVQAFLKAIQLYRQDKGRYEAWDMLIGSDVRVMANLVMEKLLPSLEKDMLPRLKAKKTEKKRVWFATVEAAYILIQEHLLEGLSELKEECRTSVKQQEVLIHSDMDQILESRRQLEEKVRAKVSEPAEKLSAESVQPYLGSVLEELMGPISSGFQEGRQLGETLMDRVCQEVGGNNEELKKALADMARPNLLSCYQKIGSLQEKLKHLQERFGFQNITDVIHSAQIDLQQLMENAAYTFEQLFQKAVQDNPDGPGPAIEKAKHRVLKQYDYDSSTVRKRISREALVSITLPFIKKSLAPTCKAELQGLDQSIYSDHSSFIHVENVYEGILLQILDKEVTKVVKEAASLKKYNLFNDSRDLLSQSSRSSLSSTSASTPGSPSMAQASPAKASSEPLPPSPLAVNGVSSSPEKQEVKEADAAPPQSDAPTEATVTVAEVEPKEEALSAAASQVEAEVTAPVVEDVFEAAQEEAVTPAPEETSKQSETSEDAAPETVVVQEAVSVAAEGAERVAEPQTQSAERVAEPQTQSANAPEAETTSSETPAAIESVKSDVAAAAAQVGAPETSPDPPKEPEESPDPPKEPEESPAPQTVATKEEAPGAASETKEEAPSSGETPATTPAEVSKELEKPVAASDPNSLDVSVGSESSPSDLESTEDVKATPSSEDEVSTTSDILDDEARRSKSPVSSDEPTEEKATSVALPPQAQGQTGSEDIEAGASVGVEPSVEVVKEETPSSPEAPPPDSIKAIRDLVVEVIEVEELVQRYPSGIPQEE
ncbi:protein Niban 1-like isoform X2 [Halichoeres trimaculatus]|uniref:protein Niban 1-like isoform X2 n=1 Tax=Halichoeres trimaculatus TaxID=147232 RepID=UPI003D9E735D